MSDETTTTRRTPRVYPEQTGYCEHGMTGIECGGIMWRKPEGAYGVHKDQQPPEPPKRPRGRPRKRG